MTDVIDKVLNPDSNKLDKAIEVIAVVLKVSEAALAVLEHQSQLSPQLATLRPALSGARAQLDNAKTQMGELRSGDDAA